MKKNSILLILLLLTQWSIYAQDAPGISSTPSCDPGFTGSMEITFNHDMAAYPLPYPVLLYQTETGTYIEDTIETVPYVRTDLEAGPYEIDVWLAD